MKRLNLKSFLDEKYYSFTVFRKMLNKEKNYNSDISFTKKMNLLFKGFSSESAIMYQLDKNNYKNYISDYQQMLTGTINGEHSYVLNNKVVFEQINQNYISIPKSLATIVNGELLPLESDISNVEEFLNYLIKNKRVVIKPISGSRGSDIFLLEYVDKKVFINNKEIEVEGITKRIKELDGFFVSEYIQQSNFSRNLFPKTINSIRIMTMIDPYTNEPFIPAAAQRIGTNQSTPTDNFAKGGLTINIDIETGQFEKVTTFPFGGELHYYKKHPDTGLDFENMNVPNWDEVKKSILTLAKHNNNLKYVGWDAVLTDEGVMIMEGNSWPDVNVHQIHEPLLLDPRVKEFYKYHGIIK